jgi:hypothetical protein
MRVYFFCRSPGPPENAGYEHGLVALAEGLRELGIAIAGNRNYWPLDGGWLIPETSEAPEAFDIVLISSESRSRDGDLPDAYIQARGPRRVYLDQADGWRTDASSAASWPADVVLRTHYNQHFRYPRRVVPWAFGLTSRMVTACGDGIAPRNRSPSVLCNFRVGHPVRDRLTAAFRVQFSGRWTWDDRIDTQAPGGQEDLRWWELTGRRHNPAYYGRLKSSQGCLAFGGFFAPGWSNAPTSLAGRLGYRLIQTWDRRTSTLTQFDSWRFWESLAADTVTIHGPLGAWGAQLPVMPEEGQHYVAYEPGIADRQVLDSWNSCLAGSGSRIWALKHYAPRPTAERLLEILS